MILRGRYHLGYRFRHRKKPAEKGRRRETAPDDNTAKDRSAGIVDVARQATPGKLLTTTFHLMYGSEQKPNELTKRFQ